MYTKSTKHKKISIYWSISEHILRYHIVWVWQEKLLSIIKTGRRMRCCKSVQVSFQLSFNLHTLVPRYYQVGYHYRYYIPDMMATFLNLNYIVSASQKVGMSNNENSRRRWVDSISRLVIIKCGLSCSQAYLIVFFDVKYMAIPCNLTNFCGIIQILRRE